MRKALNRDLVRSPLLINTTVRDFFDRPHALFGLDIYVCVCVSDCIYSGYAGGEQFKVTVLSVILFGCSLFFI